MRWALATPLLVALSAAMPAGADAPKPPREARKVLPFIEDDYARALAEARSKKLPLFIEAWAPW